MTAENTTTNLAQIGQDDEANENKFLSFQLGTETYALEILNIREIIGLIDITPLPQTPEYVNGVINLRGRIIPVVALRPRFGLATVEHDEATCIIVVEVGGKDGADSCQIGIIVDTVSEVCNIPKERIEQSPKFGCSVDTEFIMGMGKLNDQVIILLDIERVLSGEELESFQTAAGLKEEAAVSA